MSWLSDSNGRGVTPPAYKAGAINRYAKPAWYSERDLNPQSSPYKSAALTITLSEHMWV